MEEFVALVVVSVFAVLLAILAFSMVTAFAGANRFWREAEAWIRLGKCPGCGDRFAPPDQQCARCGFWLVPPGRRRVR
jgi:hypothetical protein